MMNRGLKHIVFLAVFLTGTLLVSCNDEDCNDPCTEEFITIQVTLQDQSQNPIALDSFAVITIDDGSDLTVMMDDSAFEEAQQAGIYPLVDDLSLALSQERQVQFRGFINNQEVIRSNYTVATDCCHINLVSGMLALTV